MSLNSSSAEKEICSTRIRKTEKKMYHIIIFYLKKWKKKSNILKVSRTKEIIEIKSEIKEAEKKINFKKSNKIRSLFLVQRDSLTCNQNE